MNSVLLFLRVLISVMFLEVGIRYLKWWRSLLRVYPENKFAPALLGVVAFSFALVLFVIMGMVHGHWEFESVVNDPIYTIAHVMLIGSAEMLLASYWRISVGM